MNIIIKSLLDVTIDGTPSGGVVDALFHAGAAGNEALRAPMLDALAAFCAQHADEIATLTAERDALADIIAKAKQLHSSGDHAALEAMFIEAAKSDEQKAIEAAEAKVAETARAAADAERELAAMRAGQ